MTNKPFKLGNFNFATGSPEGFFHTSKDTKRFFYFFGMEYTVVYFILSKQFVLNFEWKGKAYKLRVSPGARTDGATFPKFVWSWLGSPFSGLHIWAVIVHDFLYKVFPRLEADQIMKAICEESGFHKFKTMIVYYFVRIFGGKHWSSAQNRYKEGKHPQIIIEKV